MYFTDVLQALKRRWRVLVVGAVLIAIAAGGAIKFVPTQYEASGQMLLLLPADATGVTTPTNPYINLQSGLVTTASLIASNVSTKDTQRAMKAAGYTSEYAVALSPEGGPLLLITADDTDPKRATATRNEVIKRLTAEIARIQTTENVPPQQLIHPRTFSVTKSGEALPGSKIRALAVIGAGGIILTLIIALAIDRFRGSDKRRRPSRKERRESAENETAEVEPESKSAENESAPDESAEENTTRGVSQPTGAQLRSRLPDPTDSEVGPLTHPFGMSFEHEVVGERRR